MTLAARELTFTTVIFRILLSLLVGGMLGFERGRKNRPVGFRTYILVCLGAVLVMMTNQYVFQVLKTTDPVRMGAQVISGVGFLGAGTIMVTSKQQIKGITTAAGMWTAACCGLAIGIGFYEGAILGSVSLLIIMASMRQLDGFIRRHASIIEMYIEYEADRPFSEYLEHLRSRGIEIVDLQMNAASITESGRQSATISVEGQTKMAHKDMLQVVTSAEGILYAEEL